MKPLYTVAVCAFVLALCYAPITAQTTEASSKDDDTWKKIAIIVPIVIAALSLLIFICYCCCCQGANAWGCGDCRNCGNCGNCGDCSYCCDFNRCCPGCGEMCRCNGCGEMCQCNGCGEMCRCNLGAGECCGCNCGTGECCGCHSGNCCGLCGGDCCGGCCPQAQPAYYGDNRVVYSSSQGPIRVEEAYVYGQKPPQGGAGYSNSGYSNDRSFVSNMPVNGGDRYPVYGGFRSGGEAPGGFGVYGNYPNNLSYPPVTRQAGCGCK